MSRGARPDLHDEISLLAKSLSSEVEARSAAVSAEARASLRVAFLVQNCQLLYPLFGMRTRLGDVLATSDDSRLVEVGRTMLATADGELENALLAELGESWGCSLDEVRVRANLTRNTPSGALVHALVEAALAGFPVAVPGPMFLIEEILVRAFHVPRVGWSECVSLVAPGRDSETAILTRVVAAAYREMSLSSETRFEDERGAEARSRPGA